MSGSGLSKRMGHQRRAPHLQSESCAFASSNQLWLDQIQMTYAYYTYIQELTTPSGELTVMHFSRVNTDPMTTDNSMIGFENVVFRVAKSQNGSKTNFLSHFYLSKMPEAQWIRAQAAMNLGATAEFKSTVLAVPTVSSLGLTRNSCYRHKHMQILFKNSHHKNRMKRYSRSTKFLVRKKTFAKPITIATK